MEVALPPQRDALPVLAALELVAGAALANAATWNNKFKKELVHEFLT